MEVIGTGLILFLVLMLLVFIVYTLLHISAIEQLFLSIASLLSYHSSLKSLFLRYCY